MKTLKMNLANIQGKMSRMEMKNIMAGCGITAGNGCSNDYCTDSSSCCTGAPKCVAIGNWSGKVCARY